MCGGPQAFPVRQPLVVMECNHNFLRIGHLWRIMAINVATLELLVACGELAGDTPRTHQ